MSTALFPFAVWQSGTNENSIPANDNALRVEILMGPAVGVADSAPGSPSDGDQYVVGTGWGGHSTDNVVIYKGGVWLEFDAYEGWIKSIAGVQSLFDGTEWIEGGGGGGGIPDAPEDGSLYARRDGDWEAISDSSTPPVVTVSGTSHNIGSDESGSYLRFTSGTAKTCTFRPESSHALPENGQWEIRNAGAGNLTLTPGSGVTLTPPYDGTLVVPPGGTVAVKRAATDSFDVMGVTV